MAAIAHDIKTSGQSDSQRLHHQGTGETVTQPVGRQLSAIGSQQLKRGSADMSADEHRVLAKRLSDVGIDDAAVSAMSSPTVTPVIPAVAVLDGDTAAEQHGPSEAKAVSQMDTVTHSKIQTHTDSSTDEHSQQTPTLPPRFVYLLIYVFIYV